MARISVLHSNQKVKDLELTAGTITIGRAEDNEIQLDDKTISSHHARIVTFYNATHVEDLDSTNGTFVNGKKVTKQVLQAGDVLKIGKHQLILDDDTVNASASA